MLLMVLRNLPLFLDNDKHRQKRTLRLRNSLELEKLAKNRLWLFGQCYPNITGTLKVGNLPSFQNSYQIQGDGAFSQNVVSGYFERIANGSNATASTSVKMNASNSSSVFRGLNTVQVAALQALIIIKIWQAAGWTLAPEYMASDLLASNSIRSTPNSRPSVLE